MDNLVQAIIIRNNKILVAETSQSGSKRHLFIRGTMLEKENAEDAIRRELKEQLGLQLEITFKFKKEINKIKTFLVDINNKDYIVDKDVDKIKITNKKEEVKDVKWIEINKSVYFSLFEENYMRLLAEECISRDYKPEWLSIVESEFFNNNPASKYNKLYLNKLYKNRKYERIDSKFENSDKLKCIGLAVILGVLFDYFFIFKQFGISYILFNVVLCFAFWRTNRNIKFNNVIANISFICAILLSATYAIFNNEILRGMNIIIIPLLLITSFLLSRYNTINVFNLSILDIICERVFYQTFNCMPKFFRFIKDMKKEATNSNKNTISRNIMKGILISIPAALVILSLLASSDMIFKYYISNIGQIIKYSSFWEMVMHTLVIVISAVYIFGLLWSFKYEQEKKKENIKLQDINLEIVTVITVMVVICLIYLMFTVVQATYLYGGTTKSIPGGFTYSEYARKGFFELVAITVINFIIVLFCNRYTKKDNLILNKIVNVTYSIMIVLTFNILFSANYKMNLYVAVFGYTRLRIFVKVFMFLLALLLLILFISVWKEKIPILKYSFIAVASVYIVLNFMNVDRIIAKRNVDIYLNTKEIDVSYFYELSCDALPEMERMFIQGDIKDYTLRTDLKACIESKKRKAQYDHWYQYNYYKYKANN